MGFGSIGIRLESKELKKKVSAGIWSGGSALAPTLGLYSATQEAFGHVGGSENSAGALGSSAALFLQSPVLNIFKGF